MRLALVGSGNILFCDEGVGHYVSEYIRENYSFTPSVDIYDGGVLGMRFMELLADYDVIIVANTSSNKMLQIGEIEHISHDELLEQNDIHKTANELEIAQMLQSSVMMDRCAAVEMISVVAEDIMSVKVALSSEVKKHFMGFVDEVLESINKFGFTYKVINNITIDEIIARKL